MLYTHTYTPRTCTYIPLLVLGQSAQLLSRKVIPLTGLATYLPTYTVYLYYVYVTLYTRRPIYLVAFSLIQIIVRHLYGRTYLPRRPTRIYYESQMRITVLQEPSCLGIFWNFISDGKTPKWNGMVLWTLSETAMIDCTALRETRTLLTAQKLAAPIGYYS